MLEAIKIILPVILAVLGIVGSLVRFIMSRLADRIQALENETKKKLCKSEARIIIQDKIEPLKARIDHIDDKLDKIIEILMQGKD